jgi:hypothetical protein
MNLNNKVGFLLDIGLTPDFIVSLNESTINALYERMNKKKVEEQTTQPVNATKSTKTTDIYTLNPGGSMDVKNAVVSNKDGKTTVEMMEDDKLDEKFESKAQQGLFWARCNKCKSDDCKWCKMAKEFSKSTSKKQYKNMPEKKHPEKTVKYKKKETKENFTMANYLEKIGSVAASQMGKNVNKSMRPTFENFMTEKNLDKLVKESLQPTITKKDLLGLLKNRINEDFYFGESEMLEDFEFMAEPGVKEPVTKPKTPTEKPKEKPRRKPSRETPYENPETRPQGEDEDFDLDMMDFEFMSEPGVKEPATKPKTPTEKPKEKPRRKPERITPYENPETRPQGKEEFDFVMEKLYNKLKKK